VIHPSTRVAPVSPEIGDGVIATARISAGTIVWTQDPLDQIVTPAERLQLPPRLRAIVDRYAFVDARGDYVLCWDGGRFVNHSCDANIHGIGARVLVAVRDIAAGEEITCDYADCNLDWTLDCTCGSSRCRGRIARDELAHLAPQWDRLSVRLAPLVRTVPQPLWECMLDPAELEAMLDGRLPIPSFAELYAARDEDAANVA
jgi:uncharacterized protein